MRTGRSVIWFTGRRLPASRRSIVGKLNELPALPRVSARAIVAATVCARQQRAYNFETAPGQSILHRRTASQKRNACDLPSNFHPVAIRVSGICTPSGAGGATDGPGPHSLAAGAPFAGSRPFVPIKPIDPLDPRRLSLPPQDEQPTVAETPPLVAEIAQPATHPERGWKNSGSTSGPHRRLSRPAAPRGDPPRLLTDDQHCRRLAVQDQPARAVLEVTAAELLLRCGQSPIRRGSPELRRHVHRLRWNGATRVCLQPGEAERQSPARG